ncbi:helix-turn-helix transcriptional regulator [Streptomyces ficellus]|uniref:Helix-turn-helix transcriptional regulator n=1 Tax=Streptomyces ficellus TaxID=1977088 RepID=A0ABT7ZC51_9ACTN|nr:helix-turn-helix transcriptional regulator [Streptomyces ficellus]MDN3297001.1 helix-turn-helix transcriptional regulator [Streptomyces ficellus]
MPALDDDHTGARIKEHRKLARLTQRELAARIPYSYSLLNQVECGARPATDAFVEAVAAALGVDATVLTGPSHVTEIQQARVAALVRPIREALDLFDLEPSPTHRSQPVTDLSAAADQVCQDVRATHLRKAAKDLPPLITALTLAAQSRPSTATWQALASTYRTAHDVALKMGYRDLATVALDRMGWAAERASDPCLAAIRQYKRALGHKAAEYDLGRRLVQAGHDLLDGQDSREALAVAGQLHLGASAVAARSGDTHAVARHIAAARELAKRVGGEAREVHWLSFGQMNVALHELGASITLRQFDKALTQSRRIKLPPSTLTSRRARFLVDRAVVEMENGHSDRALRHLVEARRTAPEQTRYHPATRDAITGLLHTARRTPDTLSHMAAWIGL